MRVAMGGRIAAPATIAVMVSDSASPRRRRILCVGGARPNFMKLAPLCRALAGTPDFEPVLVHTGQHYDDTMSGQFFRELEIPTPAHNLEVGSGTHAAQTGEIMKRFEPVLEAERPDGVLVVGDVNSTMACALVAVKLHTPAIHVEAGLRSFDRSMPEEINRLVTDAIADLLLVSEDSGVRNLLSEGVSEARIRLVGNLMIDTLFWQLDRARRSDVLSRLGVNGSAFALVTLHRPSNVDDPARLSELIQSIGVIARELPVYFPIHPRTRARMDAAGIRPCPGVQLIEPLGYLDFLCMLSHSAVVLTDSGGIQEETTALGVPCLTLRENTERPVTIEEGTNRLAGTTACTILAAWEEHRRKPKTGRAPKFWDGKAALRSVEALREFLG